MVLSHHNQGSFFSFFSFTLIMRLLCFFEAFVVHSSPLMALISGCSVKIWQRTELCFCLRRRVLMEVGSDAYGINTLSVSLSSIARMATGLNDCMCCTLATVATESSFENVPLMVAACGKDRVRILGSLEDREQVRAAFELVATEEYLRSLTQYLAALPTMFLLRLRKPCAVPSRFVFMPPSPHPYGRALETASPFVLLMSPSCPFILCSSFLSNFFLTCPPFCPFCLLLCGVVRYTVPFRLRAIRPTAKRDWVM